jgi:hypothetical protein
MPPPITADAAAVALILALPHSVAFEPMRSKPDLQTKLSRKFLYLGENGESVPTDKKKDDVFLRVTASPVEEKVNGLLSTATKDDNDISPSLSLMRYEAISWNLDAILEDITDEIKEIETTSFSTTGAVEREPLEELVYASDPALGSVEVDEEERTLVGLTKEQAKDKEVFRFAEEKQQGQGAEGDHRLFEDENISSLNENSESSDQSTQEVCGSDADIVSVTWMLNKDDECVAQLDKPTPPEKEGELETPVPGDTRATLLSEETPSHVSTLPAHSNDDSARGSLHSSESMEKSARSEALHVSLLAMRLEIESREKARRQAMISCMFQQSLLQARLLIEARAKQVAATEQNVKIEETNLSFDETNIVAKGTEARAGLWKVTKETEALHRSLLATRLELEAREKARVIAVRLAMEARTRESASTESVIRADPVKEADVVIEQSEDENVFSPTSLLDEASDSSLTGSDDDTAKSFTIDSDNSFPES